MGKITLLDNFVKQCLNIPLNHFLFSRTWDEDINLCTRILQNNITDNDQQYINNKLNESDVDSRNSQQFANELILGWIIEDIINIFSTYQLGLKCELNGKDKNREFLKRSNVTTDLKINNIPVEIITDYTGFWERSNFIDLRNNKYPILKTENSLILGLDLVNEKFSIIPCGYTNGNYIYHQHWKKMVWRIEGNLNFYRWSSLKYMFNVWFNPESLFRFMR